MNEKDTEKVVTNYYKATNALIEIGTMEGISNELKNLAINASPEVRKIIDYINANKK